MHTGSASGSCVGEEGGEDGEPHRATPMPPPPPPPTHPLSLDVTGTLGAFRVKENSARAAAQQDRGASQAQKASGGTFLDQKKNADRPVASSVCKHTVGRHLKGSQQRLEDNRRRLEGGRRRLTAVGGRRFLSTGRKKRRRRVHSKTP